MAKEQKRGNREVRKPKQVKSTIADAPASLVRAAFTPSAIGKKKS